MVHFRGNRGVIFVGDTLDQVSDDDFLGGYFQASNDAGSVGKDFLSTCRQQESGVDCRVLDEGIDFDSSVFGKEFEFGADDMCLSE